MPAPERTRGARLAARGLLAVGIAALVAVLVLLRFSIVTDHMGAAWVKDPLRTPPPGRVIVAPADGTVLYVRSVSDGVVPEVVKRGVPVPLVDHFKSGERPLPDDGWLIGIYMNTDGVHINRAPVAGAVIDRIVWNGPHMDMSEAEITILLTQLVPGWVSLKKLFGIPPYAIEDEADFVLKSARETLVFRGADERRLYLVRIADFYVGKILTWVRPGQQVATGQKLGMITWGSQSDLFIERRAGLRVRASVGDYVHAGETILATY